MSKVNRFPNPQRTRLVHKLRKISKEKKVKIWGKVADDLEKSRKNRGRINLRELNKYTKENDQALVPGKVLGTGKLDHKVKIAAFKFSSKAEKKIKDVGGETLSIEELIKKNPSGSQVKILS